MRSFPLILLIAIGLPLAAVAQTAPANPPSASAAKPISANDANLASIQASLDRLTQANRDLLDLLKKQQAVLEDIQFDRRIQSRQIAALEERLQETLLQNSQLQNKITNMANAASMAPPPSSLSTTSATTSTNIASGSPPPAAEPPTPTPSTYLPPTEAIGPPGTKSWHRLFTLSGTDNKTSDIFHIDGPTWRVLWHNLDQPGKAYVNTSALFINAFPKDDTIPEKVCAKLGTGGDATELNGGGNYYLKIEASGGSWEAAVEDFR